LLEEGIFKKISDWEKNTSGWVKKELEDIDKLSEEEREMALKERFLVDADFGTGGLRGIIRAGTNGINDNWVMRISSALSRYAKRVVIAYDTRRYSYDFAILAAKVMIKNGAKVFLFSKPTPTPVLSYAVKKFNCDAGVVITASHNPPEYNGYKVYDERGVQLVPGKVNKLKGIIEAEPFFFDVDDVVEDNIEFIYDEIKNDYLNTVLDELDNLKGDFEERDNSDFSVVYSPLHGTGADFVPDILERMKVKCFTVERQMDPDSNFSTVGIPNPENPEVFELCREKAESLEKKPEVLVTTDPDADRIGILVFNGTEYVPLNGNELGVLFLDYLCRMIKLPLRSKILKTIVTTDMAFDIADKHGYDVYETLTGFKFLGDVSDKFRKEGEKVLFSFEESFGYLFGTHCGDKDAVSTIALLMLLLENIKSEFGTDLPGRLEYLRSEYGYYIEKLKSYSFYGIEGMNIINSLMNSVRNGLCDNIFEYGLKASTDFEKEKGDMKSNVIRLEFENNVKIIFRPSGTEPKIKVYLSVKNDDMDESEKTLKYIEEKIEKFIKEQTDNQE